MTLKELFPSWCDHEIAFYEKHSNALILVSNFMESGKSSWEGVEHIETMLRRFAKAWCACGERWDRESEDEGCWKCNAKIPSRRTIQSGAIYTAVCSAH